MTADQWERKEETMILIRGGRLLDPATGRDERADIVLEDNKIKEICGAGLAPERAYERVIEAENLAVAPGLWMCTCTSGIRG